MGKKPLKIWNGLDLTPQPSAPLNPEEGWLYYSDGTDRAKGVWKYENDKWQQVGGGLGNASDILIRMESVLGQTFYQFLEPNIIRLDEEAKIGSYTGTKNDVDKTIDFTVGGELTSYAMLDPEFLASQKDLVKAMAVVVFDRAGIDTNPAITLSNNGIDYQAVTMERLSVDSDSFIGELEFDLDAIAVQTLHQYPVSNADGLIALASTLHIAISQQFQADSEAVNNVSFFVTKAGAPTGKVKVNIHNDNAGDPGVIISQVLANVSDIADGNSELIVDIGSHVLLAGETYHISIETDADYKSSYNSGVDFVAIRLDVSLPTIDYCKQFDGTSWVERPENTACFAITGRSLDLKLKYVASEDSKLRGYGVLYDEVAYAGSVNPNRRFPFIFDASVLAEHEFTVPWNIDPDYITVKEVYTGQVWEYPSFLISGNKIVFPIEMFEGREEVYLMVSQKLGGSYDGNPELKRLVTENHLGSTDSNIDRSFPARGIILQNGLGVKVELAVDENNSVIIKEV